MKHTANIPLVALAASLLLSSPVFAALNFSSGYSGTTYQTHSNSNSIYSYDWGSDGNVYYGTLTQSATFGGLYRGNGGPATNVVAGNSNFAGASVVAIGSSIYFNDGSYPAGGIHRHDVGGSGAITLGAVTNYALGAYGNNLLTTGSLSYSGPSQISYYAGGALGSTIELGELPGASGPVFVDGQGYLYYAAGSDNLSIYRWSAAEVALAISSGGSNPLIAEGHLWIDYSAAFEGFAGAGSMVVDADGSLFVTMTNYGGPSELVRFDADGSGNFTRILSSNDRLGDIRMHDDNLFISEGNRIVQIVPEPSALMLSLVMGGVFLGTRRRK